MGRGMITSDGEFGLSRVKTFGSRTAETATSSYIKQEHTVPTPLKSKQLILL
jgi:hypothetical protein